MKMQTGALALAAMLALSGCGTGPALKVYQAENYTTNDARYILHIEASRDTGELGRNAFLLKDTVAAVLDNLREDYNVLGDMPAGLSREEFAEQAQVFIDQGASHVLWVEVGATSANRTSEGHALGGAYSGVSRDMPVTCRMRDLDRRGEIVAQATVNGYARHLNLVGRYAALLDVGDENAPERVYPEAITFACRTVLERISALG